MKKAVPKKAKNGVLLHSIFRLAFFAFIVYALISIISVQVTISEKQDELSAIKSKSAALEEKNGEYERLLSVADEKEYMEKLAIENLGYAYPNETRFYDVSRN